MSNLDGATQRRRVPTGKFVWFRLVVFTLVAGNFALAPFFTEMNGLQVALVLLAAGMCAMGIAWGWTDGTRPDFVQSRSGKRLLWAILTLAGVIFVVWVLTWFF